MIENKHMNNQLNSFISQIKYIKNTNNIKKIDSIGFNVSNELFEYKIYKFEEFKNLSRELLNNDTTQLLNYIENKLRISLCSVTEGNSNKNRINLFFSNRDHYKVNAFLIKLKQQCSIYNFDEIIDLNNNLAKWLKKSPLYVFGYTIKNNIVLNYKLYFMTRIEANNISDLYLYKYDNKATIKYLKDFLFFNDLYTMDLIKFLVDSKIANIHLIALDLTKDKIKKVKVYLKFQNTDIDKVIDAIRLQNFLDKKSLDLLDETISSLKKIEGLITNVMAVCVDESSNFSFNFYSDFIEKYKDVKYL